MAIISRARKPDNFKSHNSLKLSFTNIRDLRWYSDDCKSFQLILAIVSMKYLPLIQQHSSTHICIVSQFMWRKDFLLHGTYLFCRFLLMFSTGFTSLSVFLLFPYQSPCLSLCTVFDSISSIRDKVLSIKPSGSNVHHKDWLTYSGRTGRSCELCYNFSISNNLTKLFNFPTQIPHCDSYSTALLDSFLSSNASICSTMAFRPSGNSDHVAVSVPSNFPSYSQ